MRGCHIAWLQLCGTVEPESSASISMLEEQENAKDDRVIVDYKLDSDYEQEGLYGMYMHHKEPRYWPCGSKICTYSSDLVLEQPDCSSESRVYTVQIDWDPN